MALRRPRIKAAPLFLQRKPQQTPPKHVALEIAKQEISEQCENLSTSNITEKLQDEIDKNLTDLENTVVAASGSESPRNEEIIIMHCDTEPIEKIVAEEQTDLQTESLIPPSNILEQILNEEPKETLERKDLRISKLEPLKTSTPNTSAFNIVESENTNSSFKCPLKVEFNRCANNMNISGTDDAFHTDLEENVIQKDLQKTSINYPMSPSKIQSRRIHATPVLPQRRNSYIASSPSPQHFLDDSSLGEFGTQTHRRERYYSGSTYPHSNVYSSPQHHPSHKVNIGFGRNRTDSICSAISDTYASNGKTGRKMENSNNPLGNLRREFEERFHKASPLDKSCLKMSDLIFYNPTSNPMDQRSSTPISKRELLKPPEIDIKPNVDNENIDNPGGIGVPQLKLNANGEIILDDTTLEIETTAEVEARKALAKSSLLYLDENTGMNGFYKRKKRTRDWSNEETFRFYRSLQILGTDFSLMLELFPNRNRRDLKLKFKKEERSNCSLINKALLYPKMFNIEELKDQFIKEEEQRKEKVNEWIELQQLKCKNTKKKENNIPSVGARSLTNAMDIYDTETITKLRRKSKRLENAENESEQAPKRKRRRQMLKPEKPIRLPKCPIKLESVKCEAELFKLSQTCEELLPSENIIESDLLEQDLVDLLCINEPQRENIPLPKIILNAKPHLDNENDLVGTITTSENYLTSSNIIGSTQNEYIVQSAVERSEAPYVTVDSSGTPTYDAVEISDTPMLSNSSLINKGFVYPKMFNIEELKDQFTNEQEQLEENSKNTLKKENNTPSDGARTLTTAVGIDDSETDAKPDRNSKIHESSGNDSDEGSKGKCHAQMLTEKLLLPPETIIQSDLTEQDLAVLLCINEANTNGVALSRIVLNVNSELDDQNNFVGTIPTSENFVNSGNMVASTKNEQYMVHPVVESSENATYDAGDCSETPTYNVVEPSEAPTYDTVDASDIPTCDAIESSETTAYDIKMVPTTSSVLTKIEDYTAPSQPQFVKDEDKHSRLFSLVDIEETVPVEIENITLKSESTIYHLLPNEGVHIVPNHLTKLTGDEPRKELLKTDEEITCSTNIVDNDGAEAEVSKIIQQLAEGVLVLISTLDPDNNGQVINEIYMYNKSTGEIQDEPLNIPDNIVQSIIAGLT